MQEFVGTGSTLVGLQDDNPSKKNAAAKKQRLEGRIMLK
jgi:hypothetical protein